MRAGPPGGADASKQVIICQAAVGPDRWILSFFWGQVSDDVQKLALSPPHVEVTTEQVSLCMFYSLNTSSQDKIHLYYIIYT